MSDVCPSVITLIFLKILCVCKAGMESWFKKNNRILKHFKRNWDPPPIPICIFGLASSKNMRGATFPWGCILVSILFKCVFLCDTNVHWASHLTDPSELLLTSNWGLQLKFATKNMILVAQTIGNQIRARTHWIQFRLRCYKYQIYELNLANNYWGVCRITT